MNAIGNNDKCVELIEPRNIIELKKLRLCIKDIKISRELEKFNKIIEFSFDGSKKLTERIINLRKSSNILLTN